MWPQDQVNPKGTTSTPARLGVFIHPSPPQSGGCSIIHSSLEPQMQTHLLLYNFVSPTCLQGVLLSAVWSAHFILSPWESPPTLRTCTAPYLGRHCRHRAENTRAEDHDGNLGMAAMMGQVQEEAKAKIRHAMAPERRGQLCSFPSNS